MADTISLVTVSGTAAIDITAIAALVPPGKPGAPGAPGTSPTAASVASVLAANASFVAAVAAALPVITPVTPPVIPPVTPPSTGLDPHNTILSAGKFLWDTNFNYGGCSEADGQILFGAQCTVFTATATPSGGGGFLPVRNAPFFDSAGYTHLRLVLAPTRAGQSWQLVQPELPQNGVNDTPVPGGATVTIEGTYGPKPAVGVWATYDIPLSVIAPNGTNIWKWGLQDQMYWANGQNAAASALGLGNQYGCSLAQFITK